MSAVAVLRETLAADSALLAVVPATRIISGVIPKGTTLPCVAVTEVVTTEIATIDAQAIAGLVYGRAQVTILAPQYTVQKQILSLVRLACNYKRGTIAGFEVVSIRRLSNGPDFGVPEAGIHGQTLDFGVTYYEVN